MPPKKENPDDAPRDRPTLRRVLFDAVLVGSAVLIFVVVTAAVS